MKKLKSPSPVKFRVWGISTDKPFLVNEEKAISIVPSDFEQDMTDVFIKMVKPGGEFLVVIICLFHFTHCRCKTPRLFYNVVLLCQGDSNFCNLYIQNQSISLENNKKRIIRKINNNNNNNNKT